MIHGCRREKRRIRNLIRGTRFIRNDPRALLGFPGASIAVACPVVLEIVLGIVLEIDDGAATLRSA
jgi:hypothetical protein